MAWETDNLLYGRTNNPWDLSRTPGGSSGGEAAAIAAGMSAGGVGSDGGGSIRVPAHFSGICGLKPTPGRIPATGHFPGFGWSVCVVGVVGPMARTVADLKVLFEVMQGPDDGDPSAAPVPVRWPPQDDLKRIRIGYFEDDGRTPVTPETRAAVRTAAEALRRAGFQVEAFPSRGARTGPPVVVEAVWRGRRDDPRSHDPRDARQRSVRSSRSSPVGQPPSHLIPDNRCWKPGSSGMWSAYKMFAQMRKYPVLLCPVAAIPAFRHGERSWQIDGKTVQYLDAWSYCEWFNLLGTPAVVVPVGKSPEGLPIGVQIVARPWEEELVLAVASSFEEPAENGASPRSSGGTA